MAKKSQSKNSTNPNKRIPTVSMTHLYFFVSPLQLIFIPKTVYILADLKSNSLDKKLCTFFAH